MKRQYHEVRKVAWDALWHAVFLQKNGKESWDRVSEWQALIIAKRLVNPAIPDLDPEATKAGKTKNCPTCGARVTTIFDHVDGCPKTKPTKGTKTK